MTTDRLRVVVFQEEDAWIAHCLEYDIGAQASDLTTVMRRFDLTMQVELEESLRRHGTPFAGIGPAPAYIQARWTDGELNGGISGGDGQNVGNKH